jgi:hypothetical protein
VVAGLQREPLSDDGGLDDEGQDRDASDGTGSGGSTATGNPGTAGGAGGSGANCDEPDWYFLALKIVHDDCVVNDERLLRALEETQRLFPIQPAGEEREFEACDWSLTWFYEDPNDSKRWIVCPSKCTFLQDLVARVGEQIAACKLDAGTAP